MAIERMNGWKISDGRFFTDEVEAEKAEARLKFEELVIASVDFRYENINFDWLIGKKDELLDAVRDL